MGSCYDTTFYAPFANNVIVDCNRDSCNGAYFNVSNVANSVQFDFNYHAGTNAKIYGYNIVNDLNIYCKESHSCYRLTVYCPDNSSCNIYCDYTDSDTCYELDVWIENQLYNGLNLDCDDLDSSSCQYLDIGCRTGSKSQLKLYNNNWQCNSFGCCPYISGTYTCSSNVPCNINCNDQTCQNYEIDATSASSLKLNCSTGKIYKIYII